MVPNLYFTSPGHDPVMTVNTSPERVDINAAEQIEWEPLVDGDSIKNLREQNAKPTEYGLWPTYETEDENGQQAYFVVNSNGTYSRRKDLPLWAPEPSAEYPLPPYVHKFEDTYVLTHERPKYDIAMEDFTRAVENLELVLEDILPPEKEVDAAHATPENLANVYQELVESESRHLLLLPSRGAITPSIGLPELYQLDESIVRKYVNANAEAISGRWPTYRFVDEQGIEHFFVAKSASESTKEELLFGNGVVYTHVLELPPDAPDPNPDYPLPPHIYFHHGNVFLLNEQLELDTWGQIATATVDFFSDLFEDTENLARTAVWAAWNTEAAYQNVAAVTSSLGDVHAAVAKLESADPVAHQEITKAMETALGEGMAHQFQELGRILMSGNAYERTTLSLNIVEVLELHLKAIRVHQGNKSICTISQCR